MKADPKLWNRIRSIVYVSSGGFAFFAGISLYRGNESFYARYVMPCVHTLDAERAHRLAVLAAKYRLTPHYSTPDPPTLKTEVLGISVDNPVGLAAGFDKDGEAVSGLLGLGFGFVEVGSVTPLPQPGNPKPRVFRLPNQLAVINRYGFNSLGHDEVAANLKAVRSSGSFKGVIGVNLGKNRTSESPISDYTAGILRFSPLADYLVINISSPNTPGLRDWQKKEHLEELLREVVSARDSQPDTLRRPLLVKLSPDLTEQERRDIAAVINKPHCKVDGLVISNTTTRRGLPEKGESGEESAAAAEEGGLSGAPLAPLSNQLIADMYTLTQGKIPIIGVGGVFNGEDAFEKIAAGASLVQLYTALAYLGPPCVNAIKQQLQLILTEKGFSNVSEAVGSSHRK